MQPLPGGQFDLEGVGPGSRGNRGVLHMLDMGARPAVAGILRELFGQIAAEIAAAQKDHAARAGRSGIVGKDARRDRPLAQFIGSPGIERVIVERPVQPVVGILRRIGEAPPERRAGLDDRDRQRDLRCAGHLQREGCAAVASADDHNGPFVHRASFRTA